MRKEIIIILAILILSAGIVIMVLHGPSDKTSTNYIHSHTKAICDKNNYCQDYEIVCENEKIVDMNPTGAIVQFPDEWHDPRDNETKEKLCE